MIKILVRAFIVLSLTLTSLSSWADLNSPTYKSAKVAYAKSDWANALKLLKKYATEDSNYLSANPTEKTAITNAISYCQGMTETVVIASGIKIKPAPQPAIP